MVKLHHFLTKSQIFGNMSTSISKNYERRQLKCYETRFLRNIIYSNYEKGVGFQRTNLDLFDKC